MVRIKPVHLNDTGALVSNLHKGLLFLIVRQTGISDNDRRSLADQLAPDVRSLRFGDATLNVVKIWQEQLKNRFGLPVVNGDVDQPTADALNKVLTGVGAL